MTQVKIPARTQDLICKCRSVIQTLVSDNKPEIIKEAINISFDDDVFNIISIDSSGQAFEVGYSKTKFKKFGKTSIEEVINDKVMSMLCYLVDNTDQTKVNNMEKHMGIPAETFLENYCQGNEFYHMSKVDNALVIELKS